MNHAQFDILYGDPNHPETLSGLAESPIWDEQRQAWFWIDIPKRLIHFHQNTQHHIWHLPQNLDHDPGAIALTTDGMLLIALRRGLALMNPNTNTDCPALRYLLDAPYDTATMRFNDGGVDAQGRWWIGSLFAPKTYAGASLFCFDGCNLIPVAGPLARHPENQSWGVTTSNGWAVSSDGTKLYQADTQAHTVYSFDYNPQAPIELSLTQRKIIFQTADTRNTDQPYWGRPDGAAIDSQDHYWSAQFEGANITHLDPNGKLIERIMLPAKCATMIAFGGTDFKTMLITTVGDRPASEQQLYPLNGCILTLKTQQAGQPSHRVRLNSKFKTD